MFSKPEGSADADIKANNLLESYMDRVLQRTLPKETWESWGLSVQDALDAGLSPVPQTTWLHNRLNSGDRAVNAESVTIVVALTRLALEGRIRKRFNPQNTAEKILKFFHDELGCSFSSTHLYGSGPYDKENIAACLSACVESLFSTLVDKTGAPRQMLRRTIEDTLPSFLKADKTREPGISVVRNRAREYAAAFDSPLHLEDAFERRASLKDIFISPHASDLSGKGPATPIQDSLEELIGFCKAPITDPGSERNCIAILSDAGSGKTSLLKALCYTLEKDGNDGRGIICVPFSEMDADELVRQNDPVEYLRRALGKEEEGFDESTILLDGLDELYLGLPAGKSSMDFFNKLVYRCSERSGCRFVITSRADYIDQGLLDKETKPRVRIVKLEKMSKEEALGMVYNLAMIHGSLGAPAIMAIPTMYQQLDFLSVPLLLYTVVALEIDISATKEKGELYRQIFSEMESRAYNRPALDVQNNEGRIRDLRLYAQIAATEMRRRGVVSLDRQGAKIVADRLRHLGVSEDGIAKAQQAFTLSLYTLYGTSGFLHRSFGEFLAAEDVYRFVIEGLDETLTEEEWFELADYFFSGHILTNEVKRFFAYEVDSRSASAEDIAGFLTKKLIHVVIQNGVVTSLADEANDCTLEKIECVVVNLWLLIKFIQTTAPVLDNETLASKESLLRYLLLAREDQHFPLVLNRENLSFLDLRRRNFYSSSLRKCRFFKSRLRAAYFRNADLRGADLRFADLSYADFRGAMLSGANLSYANIAGADFSNALVSKDEPVIVSLEQKEALDYFSIPYEAKNITANEANSRFYEALRMLIKDEEEVNEPDFEYAFISLKDASHDDKVDQKLLEYRQQTKYVPSTASYYLIDLETGESYGPDLEEFIFLIRSLFEPGDQNP